MRAEGCWSCCIERRCRQFADTSQLISQSAKIFGTRMKSPSRWGA